MSKLFASLLPLIIFNGFIIVMALIFRPIYRKRGATQEVEGRHHSKFLNKWFREFWLWLTDPCVRFFIRNKITPNKLTFIGTVIGFISGIFFATSHFGLGGWAMIFGATFDIFDGRVARLTGQETKSGAYFDSVMDRISEGAFFIGLAIYYAPVWWAQLLVLLCTLGSVMVSYTKAKGDEAGAKYSGGSMQRPERIVYLGVGAIFSPVVAAVINLFWQPTIHTLRFYDYVYLFPLCLVVVMTWITSIDRMKNVMKILDSVNNH